MRKFLVGLATLLFSNAAFADIVTFDSIPIVPGTGMDILTGVTDFESVELVQTPIFTVPVQGTVTTYPIAVADQYGDIGYLFSAVIFGHTDGLTTFGYTPLAECNTRDDPSCGLASLPVPSPVVTSFSLPAFSNITYANGDLAISAVPELATRALILIGFAGLGLIASIRRWRTKLA